MQRIFNFIIIAVFFLLGLRATERADNVLDAVSRIVNRCVASVESCGNSLTQRHEGESDMQPLSQEALGFVRQQAITDFDFLPDTFKDPLEQMQTVVGLFPVRHIRGSKNLLMSKGTLRTCAKIVEGAYVNLCIN